ncbi:hypothetical protein ACFVAV_07025 [Nocardia sp. NPDC057663]
MHTHTRKTMAGTLFVVAMDSETARILHVDLDPTGVAAQKIVRQAR